MCGNGAVLEPLTHLGISETGEKIVGRFRGVDEKSFYQGRRCSPLLPSFIHISPFPSDTIAAMKMSVDCVIFNG